MINGLVNRTAEAEEPVESRAYGVAVGTVIDNVDLSQEGRVQVRIAWLPNFDPWARVAVLQAGPNRGTYLIPQINDEVLLAFEHGNVTTPYVIGSLWNGQDRPPTLDPTDAVTKRIIRTPVGHEVIFDDVQQSIKITSSTDQKITIDPKKITLETSEGTATITLDQTGQITLEAKQSLTLKAPTITLEGQTVDIKSNVKTNINGGNLCNIQASLVKIN